MKKIWAVLALSVIIVIGASMGIYAADGVGVYLQTGPTPSTVGAELEIGLSPKTSLIAVGHGKNISAGFRIHTSGATGPLVTTYAGYNWDNSEWWVGISGGYAYRLADLFTLKGEVGGAYASDEGEFKALTVLGIGYHF